MMQSRGERILDCMAVGAGGGPLLATIGYVVGRTFVDSVSFCQSWMPDVRSAYVNMTHILETTRKVLLPNVTDFKTLTENRLLGSLNDPTSKLIFFRIDIAMSEYGDMRTALNQLINNATHYSVVLAGQAVQQGLLQACIGQLSPVGIAVKCYGIGYVLGGALGIAYGLLYTGDEPAPSQADAVRPVVEEKPVAEAVPALVMEPVSAIATSPAVLFAKRNDSVPELERASLRGTLTDLKKLSATQKLIPRNL